MFDGCRKRWMVASPGLRVLWCFLCWRFTRCVFGIETTWNVWPDGMEQRVKERCIIRTRNTLTFLFGSNIDNLGEDELVS